MQTLSLQKRLMSCLFSPLRSRASQEYSQDAALATRLKKQRRTCQTSHAPPCEASRGGVGHQTAMCEVTACTEWIVWKEDTASSRRRLAARGIRTQAATSCDTKMKTAERSVSARSSYCRCVTQADRAGVRMHQRQHQPYCISHLGECRTAHRQWVSETSKELQLPCSPRSWSPSNSARTSSVRKGKIIMSL